MVTAFALDNNNGTDVDAELCSSLHILIKRILWFLHTPVFINRSPVTAVSDSKSCGAVQCWFLFWSLLLLCHDHQGRSSLQLHWFSCFPVSGLIFSSVVFVLPSLMGLNALSISIHKLYFLLLLVWLVHSCFCFSPLIYPDRIEKSEANRSCIVSIMEQIKLLVAWKFFCQTQIPNMFQLWSFSYLLVFSLKYLAMNLWSMHRFYWQDISSNTKSLTEMHQNLQPLFHCCGLIKILPLLSISLYRIAVKCIQSFSLKPLCRSSYILLDDANVWSLSKWRYRHRRLSGATTIILFERYLQFFLVTYPFDITV